MVSDPSHGFLYDFGQLLPSYWLVQASHVALGGHPLSTKGWVVIVAWTVVLAAVATPRLSSRHRARVGLLASCDGPGLYGAGHEQID